MAHPAVLRDLIEQYEALVALDASEADSARVRQRMEDVAYTLCVSTGTRDIDAALIAARHRLPGARPQDDSLLSGS
ncbi:alpha-D-ribose 1-methylphosphonate 5-phosphate C-P lyase [Streptomyces griseostramineus]|uniref:Alpha-D-ribose 1-methylphosphonate 5-phosphate C-P lyase n=2 Tax=Streptomyces griseomycini TaxID=66895 RepID=A0A7W7PRK7_9ACTN|nr:alpha-D-ribose 1-methylphosphonate 5-phosphate C-P lyase [Streptomyces griseomycini]